MHPRTTELLDYCDTEVRHLRSAVDSVPADRRDWRPSPAAWSTNEVITHLAMTERRIAGILGTTLGEARAAGLRAETDTSPIMPSIDVSSVLDRSAKVTAPDRSNPRITGDKFGWEEYESARNAIRAVIVEHDGMALGDVTYPHPVFGPLNLYQWFAFVAAHGRRHAEQIREIATESSRSGTTAGAS